VHYNAIWTLKQSDIRRLRTAEMDGTQQDEVY